MKRLIILFLFIILLSIQFILTSCNNDNDNGIADSMIEHEMSAKIEKGKIDSDNSNDKNSSTDSTFEEAKKTTVNRINDPVLKGTEHDFYFYEPNRKEYAVINRLIGGKTNLTLSYLINDITWSLGLSPLINSIYQINTTVYIDWKKEFVDSLSSAEIEDILLSSIAMTLVRNPIDITDVVFLVDNQSYVSAYRSIQGNQIYTYPDYKPYEGTASDFDLLRKDIPLEESFFIRENDAKDSVHAAINKILDPQKDVLSISDLDNQYILMSGIVNSKWYGSYVYNEPADFPISILYLSASSTDYFSIVVKEHVENQIHSIFGDVPLKHESIGGWEWLERLGIYSIPGSDWGPSVQHILSVKEYENHYVVILVYYYPSMDTDYLFGDDGKAFLKNEFDNALASNLLKKREIILDKAADGNLVFRSHRYIT